MPYEVSDDCGCPKSEPYGIKVKTSGKRVGGCHKSRTKAMSQMRAIQMSEHEVKMELGMKNPVILGVAATNRPHVRLREHPMSIVEIDGKKMVRVPFMVKGKYRHPMGSLDFTDDVFEKMITNHIQKVGDFGEGLDVKHIPDLGSLAWFDPDLGGKIVKEDNLLVGYGVPTGDDSLKFIENGKFRWASVEFHPDYKSTLEKKYLESTLVDTVDLSLEEEGNIQLANPYRDAFGKWASKGGSAVKKVGGTVKNTAKEFGGGAKEVFTKSSKRIKEEGKGKKTSRARKFGRAAGVAGALAAGAYVGIKAADATMRVPKRKLELETPRDLQPTLIREALSEYTVQGQEGDFLWLDKEIYDLNEFNLPEEEGHYKVDKATAEAMLAAVNELAQEQPELFYTEDDMQTLEEALARIEELEGQLEELQANVEPEMSEREKAMAARIEALERAEVEKTIQLEIQTARNYKDGEGRGHSAVVLNFLGDLMAGKPLNDGAIKLESYTDPAAIAKYFRDGLALFLKTAPGTQPVDGKTIVDDTRTLENAETADLYEAGKAAAKSFWG